jgi:hypothetical protein
MKVKQWSLVLMAAGILMLAFVLLATPLHIYGSGYGPKHIIGTVVSSVVFIAGIAAFFISGPKSESK